MDIEFDTTKAKSNLSKHRVSFVRDRTRLISVRKASRGEAKQYHA
ncbi:MAG TPA: hypothetical protein PKC59_08730 [Burkholderiaceae bacterium]|nr:hypothetical protein [Burkholderiaceae bacterium]HMX10049.1 hypothetical protein [Burkholderiaceae bacterium]HMY98941.1 hypothetical protein [Burkholderiaceae bacterium]HNB44253.1 hypothetical protein [Burkholderiaceae bacterium]HNG79091.1 hypothetical protein [Burkholderiaceae bacterium]